MSNTLDLNTVEKRCREYLTRSHMRPVFSWLHGIFALVLFFVIGWLFVTSLVAMKSELLANIAVIALVLLVPAGFWIHALILARQADRRYAIACPCCGNEIRGRELPVLGFFGEMSTM